MWGNTKKEAPLSKDRVVSKSQAALSTFRSAVEQLKDASADAFKIKEANANQIAKLEEENTLLDTVTQDNSKVIDNISSLIGIKPEKKDE